MAASYTRFHVERVINCGTLARFMHLIVNLERIFLTDNFALYNCFVFNHKKIYEIYYKSIIKAKNYKNKI